MSLTGQKDVVDNGASVEGYCSVPGGAEGCGRQWGVSRGAL